MMNTRMPVSRISSRERKYNAPPNWTIVTNAVGIVRHTASVTEAESASIRLSRSPLWNASRPFHWLFIRCSNSLLCKPLRSLTSVLVVKRLRMTDRSSWAVRQIDIQPIYAPRLSLDMPVAMSIKCLQTNTKHNDTLTFNAPVKAHHTTDNRKPSDAAHSHFIHSFIRKDDTTFLIMGCTQSAYEQQVSP